MVYLIVGILGNTSLCLSFALQARRFETACRMQRESVASCASPLPATRTVSESFSESSTSESSHRCHFCNATFVSRNALFRHVRSDPTCSTLANNGTPFSHLMTPKRHKIALQFQYFSTDTLNHDNEFLDSTATSEAGVAGNVLQSAVLGAVTIIVQQTFEGLQDCSNDVGVELKSTTQSSISKLRHCSLAQESNCAAAADVMVMSFDAPAAISCATDGSKEDPNRQRDFANKLIATTNELLVKDSSSSGLIVTLLACKFLSSDSKLHAERSCTQRIYHYLMPLDWLPGGKHLAEWWMTSEQRESLSEQGVTNHHESRVSTRPPNDSLLRLKQALKSAESGTVNSTSPYNDTSSQAASGRFGTLANKIKRPWHNFADPNLRGDASPNNEPVWRVVDRARLVQLQTAFNNQVYAVLEFRGNDFLPQQIRRMVGTVVAMTHGWIPLSTLDLLTRSDVFIQAPLAPAGHLYLDSVRFHFDELRTSGQGIFDNEVDGIVTRRSVEGATVREHLLLSKLSREAVRESDNLWLLQLRDEVAPGIRQQLESVSEDNGAFFLEGTREKLSPAPPCYGNTLELLRNIVGTGQWPATSAARLNVIRESNDKKGSFTVVNPLMYGKDVDSDSLPLGNSLFPDLVKAVFDLELFLSELKPACATADGIETNQPRERRLASSHCAINSNAEFTPHVDSGRGAGQSLSMIVGLGDYVGGELAVEGPNYDIRYRPLEFDGWKLRHWTLPFAGERFSLVWFTPEVKGKE